jgi:phosphate starvation-inducible membrane PsiE
MLNHGPNKSSSFTEFMGFLTQALKLAREKTPKAVFARVLGFFLYVGLAALLVTTLVLQHDSKVLATSIVILSLVSIRGLLFWFGHDRLNPIVWNAAVLLYILALLCAGGYAVFRILNPPQQPFQSTVQGSLVPSPPAEPGRGQGQEKEPPKPEQPKTTPTGQTATTKVNGSNNVTSTVNQSGNNDIAVTENNNNVNAGPQLSGWLLPGTEKTPQQECLSLNELQHVVTGLKPIEIPDDHLAVFFGGNVSVNKNFPKTVIQVADKPALVMEKNENGELAVTMDIFDSDPKPRLIARIEQNRFRINPNNYFDVKQSQDGSRLEVVDQQGTEVLDIRYLNKHAVRIKAVLYFPGVSDPLIIGDADLTWRHASFHGNCAGDSSKETPMLNLLPKSAQFTSGFTLR